MPRHLTVWLLAALLVLAAGTDAGRAQAQTGAQTHAPVDIACAWSAMPQGARDAFLAAAPDPDQMSSVAQAQMQALGAAAAQCHVSLDGDAAALYGQAITSKVLEVWSADQLHMHANIDEAALEQAWRSLPAADRASIAHEVKNGLAPSKAEIADMQKAYVDIGVRDEQGLKYAMYYVAARALLAELAGLP
jgi:hypothetical protein